MERITLSRNGVWLSDGGEITHEETARTFFKSIARTQDGYELRIGWETYPIEVEDTAYFVVGWNLEGIVTLSDQSQEKLDWETLRYSSGRLSCRVKGGTEEAKFLRTPYLELLKGLAIQNGYYGIQGKAGFVPLAPVTDEATDK